VKVGLLNVSFQGHCVTPNICKLVAVICLLNPIESLLVVASVGVQLTTTFASGRQTAMFYDIADIGGIVINEAVTMVNKTLCFLHYES